MDRLFLKLNRFIGTLLCNVCLSYCPIREAIATLLIPNSECYYLELHNAMTIY